MAMLVNRSVPDISIMLVPHVIDFYCHHRCWEDLGLKVNDLFDVFEEEPLAAASIAQVSDIDVYAHTSMPPIPSMNGIVTYIENGWFFMINVAKFANRPMDPLWVWYCRLFGGKLGSNEVFGASTRWALSSSKKKFSGFQLPKGLKNPPRATFGDGYSYNGK